MLTSLHAFINTDELKKLLKGSTAVLILDNGEPSFVVLGYDSYKNLLLDQEKEVKINHPGNGRPDLPKDRESGDDGDNKLQPNSSGSANSSPFQHRISEKEAELLEKINKEILSLKNEIDKEEKLTTTPAID